MRSLPLHSCAAPATRSKRTHPSVWEGWLQGGTTREGGGGGTGTGCCIASRIASRIASVRHVWWDRRVTHERRGQTSPDL